MSLLASDDTTVPSVDPNKKYLEELVGEGKKFKDQESLARGKYEADLMIEKLKEEQAKLREDYLELRKDSMAKASFQELIDRLNKSNSDTQSDDEPVVPAKVEQPQIDLKQIESLVSSKLQEAEQTRKEQANFNSVKEKLRELHGDQYQQILKTNMERLGLTEEFTNELARKHPQAFLKTFGVETAKQQETFQAPPRGQASFTPKPGEKRDWEYYETLRRTKPDRYWDPRTQVQMHHDRIAMGNAFKAGDYTLDD